MASFLARLSPCQGRLFIMEREKGFSAEAPLQTRFIGPRPVGAKHSDNNLSVKPEIFYPNASPLPFQQTQNS
ncbi:MAG: hypothetical protein ACKPKF_10735 [Microcystis panniformis]